MLHPALPPVSFNWHHPLSNPLPLPRSRPFLAQCGLLPLHLPSPTHMLEPSLPPQSPPSPPPRGKEPHQGSTRMRHIKHVLKPFPVRSRAGTGTLQERATESPALLLPPAPSHWAAEWSGARPTPKNPPRARERRAVGDGCCLGGYMQGGTLHCNRSSQHLQPVPGLHSPARMSLGTWVMLPLTLYFQETVNR